MNSKETKNKEEVDADFAALIDSMCDEPTAAEQAAFRRSLGQKGDTIVGTDEDGNIVLETL
jgi:hypothetical protein